MAARSLGPLNANEVPNNSLELFLFRPLHSRVGVRRVYLSRESGSRLAGTAPEESAISVNGSDGRVADVKGPDSDPEFVAVRAGEFETQPAVNWLASLRGEWSSSGNHTLFQKKID